MPYRVGARGSYGCSGYATVDDEGEVYGCHPTRARALAQSRALWASETSKSISSVSKAMVSAGDFVMFICHDEKIKVGRVEYVMDNEGTLGLEGSEYALEYDESDKPLIIRIYDDEDGAWEESEYLVYHRMSEVVKIESLVVAKDVMYEVNGNEMTEMSKRDYSTEDRRRMAASGQAMPDGSFPIADEADLRNAIQAVGRAANYEAAKRHIMRRARALGLTNLLPEEWTGGSMNKSLWGGVFDPRG